MGTVMEERVKKMLGGNLKCEPRDENRRETFHLRRFDEFFFGSLWILYIFFKIELGSVLPFEKW